MSDAELVRLARAGRIHDHEDHWADRKPFAIKERQGPRRRGIQGEAGSGRRARAPARLLGNSSPPGITDPVSSG